MCENDRWRFDIGKSVVVIGGGVGGLSAAIYARVAGHDVCLLEANSQVGGKAAAIQVGEYRLDPGPSIVILKKLYEQLFRDAGREMGRYLRFQRLDPISRVFFGNGPPIDLPADRDRCERLVEEIDASDGRSFRGLMRQLDHVGPMIERTIFAHPMDRPTQLLDRDLLSISKHMDVRRPYKAVVDSMFRSPLLRAFFYGFPSYSGQSYDSKAPGALLIPYLMIQDGVYYPEGGVGAIPNALCTLAKELGVEIRSDSRVVKLNAKGKSVTSAVLADGRVLEGEVFISGVDRLTTRQWLGLRQDLKPSFSYFTAHWGLRRQGSNLLHHNLLIPDEFETGLVGLYRRHEFPTPPIVYLNETSITDPSVAPSGCSNVFAVVTSPAVESHVDWHVESERAYAAMRRVMDSFDISIGRNEVEFERIQTPLYFEESHGNYKGSLYGPDERHRLYRMFPLRNKDERYRNLLYCGGSVQPGAGLPMVLLSGKFAASKIG